MGWEGRGVEWRGGEGRGGVKDGRGVEGRVSNEGWDEMGVVVRDGREWEGMGGMGKDQNGCEGRRDGMRQ